MSTIDGARDSYLNPPASSTTEPSASGVTTPDLVAEEKERRQSSEQSINEKDRAVVTDADDTPAEVYPTGRGLVPILIALIFSVRTSVRTACETYTNFVPTPLAGVLGGYRHE